MEYHRCNASDGAATVRIGPTTNEQVRTARIMEEQKYSHFQMRVSIALAVLVCVWGASALNDELPPAQLIANAGFPVETHTIVTQDGYVLNTQRIPLPGAPPVVLMHGLLDSAATFVLSGPNASLAFALARAGFDVWLPNQRGNRYSTTMANGTTFDWLFSIDELGHYDMPAVVQYVLAANGAHSTLSWIGHSRGTQQVFYGLSSMSRAVAPRINMFIALAPVFAVKHTTSRFIHDLVRFDTHDLFDTLHYHDFLPSTGTAGSTVCTLCRACCEDIIAAIAGPGTHNASRFNSSLWPVYAGHFPAGTSSRVIAHYCQLVHSDPLPSMYDFGTAAKNRLHYGSDRPPVYNISAFPTTLPVALFSGGNDDLADPVDVAALAASLGARVVLNHVEPSWNHFDPVWGLEAPARIYPAIVSLLRAHTS